MTYSVFWSLVAIQQLNQVEAGAADPRSVSQAAASVDYALRRAPHDMGEERSGNARLWFLDMLGVYFTVDDVAMRVDVLLVGPARRR